MIVDCHVHTAFSADSKMRIEDACKAAVQNGLGGVIFTDHVDLPSSKWIFDPVARAASIKSYLANESPVKLEILQGVELGFQPHVVDVSTQFVRSFPFDFVLLSVHKVAGMEISDAAFHEWRSIEERCRCYIEEIYTSVDQFDDFDVVGHIGYILRYLPRGHTLEEFPCCCELLDKLFVRIIQKGKGIEVNASGYRYGLENPSPTSYLLRRYRELGGELITLGSDAHKPSAIGSPFEKVKALLLSHGFTYATYFKKRGALKVPL